jgi:hypothetical protein
MPDIEGVKNDLDLEMSLEEEKKKCLKNLQNFYKKYGCEEITKLKEYLTSLLLTIDDTETLNKDEINEIKKQLELLEDYS